MSIQIQGYGGVVVEVDGTTYRALRVTLRPVDYGSLGQYRCALLSGTMAAGLAAGSQVFQARWTSSPQLCLVWGVSLDGLAGSSTTFSAGFASFNLIIARAWTADGSGGNSATLTGNNQKLRTSMGTSLMGSMRCASTAALGTGTQTLDNQSEGQITFAVGTTASVNYLLQTSLYGPSSLEDGGNPAPIVLAQNEGVVARATVPATGTWQFGVTMAWSEVASY
jgi:hypothetical protein